ncbi:MAG TPA: trigger factor, partial [Stellaceae bacterium]|nr:trigger factor [Stellaceae bacterium]
DTTGEAEGREIPGAAGQDRQITLGSGGALPGFEDQLVGARAGEERTVQVTFPADYPIADLAGKEGRFAVTVKEVRQKQPLAIDDALAQAVGLENLGELRAEVKEGLQRNYDQAARLRLKRALLDKLAERYDFPLPPGMVDLEFENIWAQYRAAEENEPAEAAGAAAEQAAPAEAEEGAPAAPENAGAAAEPGAEEAPPTGEGHPEGQEGETDEAAMKAEYRRIAERRVKLGLLLAETGRKNNITVSQEELNQALAREARRHPGHERQVIDFYRQNPAALGNLRAPILEDKVIDFIVELAKPEVRKVTPQELLEMPEPDEAQTTT